MGVQNGRVTFRYRDGQTKQIRSCTLPVLAFRGRFLQHVLPKRFVKVRYYGLFSRGQRALLRQIREQLALARPSPARATPAAVAVLAPSGAPGVVRCVVCGQPMQAAVLRRLRSRGPAAAPHAGQAGDNGA